MKRNRPLNEKKREAIILAAIEEFYVKGYEGSSMDTISKEANVSKATVYNHFKNKEELFFAIAQIIKQRLEESFDYTYKKEKNINDQLREIANQELAFLNSEENLKLIQIFTLVIMQKNEIGQKLMEEAKDNCMLMTSKWFDDAKDDGKLEFESSLFVSQQFIGMIKSFIFYPQLYGAPRLSDIEQKYIVDKAIEMVIKLYAK